MVPLSLRRLGLHDSSVLRRRPLPWITDDGSGPTASQLILELGDQDGWDRHSADTGCGLGRREYERPVLELPEPVGDVHGRVKVLHAGNADATRVLEDHLVVDGRSEDAAQQSVALCRGRGTRARPAEQSCMPRSDRCGLEIGQDERTERRRDVETQEAVVPRPRARSRERALEQPTRRVLLQSGLGASGSTQPLRSMSFASSRRCAWASQIVGNVRGARCSTVPTRERAWNRPDGKRRTLPRGLRRVIANDSCDEQERTRHERALCPAARWTRDGRPDDPAPSASGRVAAARSGTPVDDPRNPETTKPPCGRGSAPERVARIVVRWVAWS